MQEQVVTTVYKKLQECGAMLEGTLLKPSMTVSGVDCKDKPTPEQIAEYTVQTLQRSVPAAVPGITFLSGGISEEDSSIYLIEINKIDRVGPWAMTFSFSRAMQSLCLKQWGGEEKNKKKAQQQPGRPCGCQIASLHRILCAWISTFGPSLPLRVELCLLNA